jgi:hypothetical protein
MTEGIIRLGDGSFSGLRRLRATGRRLRSGPHPFMAGPNFKETEPLLGIMQIKLCNMVLCGWSQLLFYSWPATGPGFDSYWFTAPPI